VANALLVRGSLTFGGAVFLLHSSVEAAMAAALSLPEEDAPLTPHRPRVTSRPSPRDGVNGWRRAQGGSSTRGVPFVRQRIPRIHAPNLPPLLPLPGVDTSACQPARAPREPATGFTPPHPPAHTPYLAAVLKPAASPPPTTRKTLPPLPASGFFRCLSPDHNVKDCRDPVRCRRCRGSGHRQHRCKMPVNRVLAPWPRRGALSTPLTGSVSPSSPRSASAPPRPSPSPPPRSPPVNAVPPPSLPVSGGPPPRHQVRCSCPVRGRDAERASAGVSRPPALGGRSLCWRSGSVRPPVAGFLLARQALASSVFRSSRSSCGGRLLAQRHELGRAPAA
jgi:hypothetical protein